MNNTDTFFKIDFKNLSAGIWHHTSNYHALIKYCYENKLKLVKPIFKLAGSHNNGKDIISNLSLYYDLDNICVNDEKFTVYDERIINENSVIVRYSPTNGLLRVINPFNTIKNNYSVSMPYNPSLIQIASDVVKKIGSEFMCIHVRRGDRITSKQIDIDTQPPNILRIITKYNANTVYIMTNRINELKQLRNIKDRKIYFFNDFQELKSIKDNYYLFSIENIIMNLANIRCSTFNSPDTKYHCYLTNPGGCK